MRYVVRFNEFHELRDELRRSVRRDGEVVMGKARSQVPGSRYPNSIRLPDGGVIRAPRGTRWPIRHEDTLAYKMGYPADVEWSTIMPASVDPLAVPGVTAEEAVAALRLMAGGCAHENEVEIDLVVTGEVVAWWCPDCGGRKYAPGW